MLELAASKGADAADTTGFNRAGIAFPTCISPNHCVGHYSPLVSEDTVEIKEGDIVKIDLGVHVDGYIAVVAHTLASQHAPQGASLGAHPLEPPPGAQLQLATPLSPGAGTAGLRRRAALWKYPVGAQLEAEARPPASPKAVDALGLSCRLS